MYGGRERAGRAEILDKKADTRMLVVDDEKQIAQICAHFLKRGGFDAVTVHSGEDAIRHVAADELIGIVFLDIRLPDMNGVDVLRELRRIRPDLEVVMITAHGTIQDAVKCMKRGAVDFVPKPFKRERLLAAAEQSYKVQSLRLQVSRLLRQMRESYRFGEMIGQSKKMHDLFARLAQIVETERPVMILGQPGTGKDLLARTIHYNGLHARGPFVPVNCAALPPDLIEGELFGYRKGSFPGAVRDSVGLLRSAEGGTVFLDEVDALPVQAQKKLLGVIRSMKVQPLGGDREIPVHVRLLSAADPGIQEMVDAGEFHRDLHLRLNAVSLSLPPLCERTEDIPLLAEHFLRRANRRFGKEVKGIDPGVREVLRNNPWRGNVRELEAVIEGAVAFTKGKTLTRRDLPDSLLSSSSGSLASTKGVLTLREAEKIALQRALEESSGNISKAARTLETTRKRVYNLIERHGIRS